MLTYTITEAKAHLSEVIEKVMAGEEIIVTKMGKEVARIAPPPKKAKKKRLLGLCKGDYYMAEDFDTLPDEMARAFGMID